MSDATQLSRLDAETESTLARRWRDDRDPVARDRLLLCHQFVVRSQARRHRYAGCSVADLEQEGNIGLLRALDRFDPDRGVRLATYAAWWIRAFMLRFIEHNSRMIRGATTTNRSRLFYQLGKTKERLLAEGEDASRAGVAKALGVDEQDVVAMELLRAPTASLDAPAAGFERDGGRMVDRVADADATPEQSLESAELRHQLDTVLDRFSATLTGRSLEMFRERVATDRPASLNELSARWGITRAAARRLEHRVSQPLRRYLYREMGDTIAATLGGV
jgi:RNA polymerase sigma-32 factor